MKLSTLKVTIQTSYNISPKTFIIQLKLTKHAKQENMIYYQEGKKKAVNRNQFQDEPDVGISKHGL